MLMIRIYLIIVFSVFSLTFVVGRGRFPYTKCKDTAQGIDCEKIHVDRGKRDSISVWPPGPFALPMSKYGCPEPNSKGWVRRYMKISWKEPHSVFVTNLQIPREEIKAHNFSMFSNITSNVWPSTGSTIQGPYGAYSWTMNFCLKTRSNDTLDTGNWPAGIYMIYSVHPAISDCPEGFSEVEENLKLPRSVSVTSSGQLPVVDVREFKDYVHVKFRLCERVSNQTNQIHNDKVKETVFVLIKADNASCPELAESIVEEETLFGSRFGAGDQNVDIVYTYCHYQPKSMGLNHYHIREMSARLLSQFTITYGQIETISLYTWIQFDFRQTMSVSMIKLDPPFAVTLTRCFYGDTKNGFIYLEARECLTTISTSWLDNSLYLLFGDLQARYITIVMGDVNIASQDSIRNASEVFFNHLEKGDVESCNEDIGMADGRIQDFQIQTSSEQEKYTPPLARPGRTGWCAMDTDTDPWIMVDLITKMHLEGVSFWNHNVTSANIWMNADQIQYQSACSCCKKRVVDVILHHGLKRDNLTPLQENLHLDENKPVGEEQAFMFGTLIEARYVKLKLNNDLGATMNCLRFELRGCKLSGVQTMTCKNGAVSEMFTISNEIRGTENEERNTSSVTECETLCLDALNCSTTQFDENGNCVLHNSNPLDVWRFSTPAQTIGHWSAKICSKEPAAILPIQLYTDGSISSNMQHVTSSGVIASIGYPFTCGHGEVYKWSVLFPTDISVGIVFTNISLRGWENTESICSDKIHLHSGIMHDEYSKQIDYSFNKRVVFVELSTSQVYVTFETCGPELKNNTPVYFRARVTNENIFACMSLKSKLNWKEGRIETCDMNIRSEMFLTSMSYLNFPFVNTTERWDIFASKHHMIQLYFVEFYVRCPQSYDSVSHSIFTVINLHEENAYCNTKRPPDILSSHTEKMTVTFIKREIEKAILRREGFRILIRSTDQSLEKYTDFKRSNNHVTNVALGKPAIMNIQEASQFQFRNWATADTATDGDRFPLIFGSCISAEDYTSFHPWWAVDLNGVYKIYSVLLYISITASFFKPQFVIEAGLDINTLEWTNECAGYGKRVLFSPKGVAARYVKVTAIFTPTLNLCETEIYGVLEKEIGASQYGDLEAFISPDANPTDYRWYQTCSMMLDESVRYSEWTSWSDCSVNCGTGLKTRTRSCLETSFNCTGRLSETDVCFASRVCPICSERYQKCYTLFSELTNWDTAGFRCWKQNTTLVKIESKDEMEYVSYLLRDFRYNDSFVLYKNGNETEETYFTHIGLFRKLSLDGKKTNTWEDTSPVIFSAWNSGHPTTENCTKMDFRVFHAERTWYSENCKSGLAQYYVCQEPIDDKIMYSDRERISINASSYVGTLNRTVSGQTCLRWDSNLLIDAFTPESMNFRDYNISEAENFCRDPWGSGYLICFTSVYGRKVNWERCITPESENSHCKVSSWMEEGHVNVTYSGKLCVNWSIANNDSRYSSMDLSEDNNQCVDPNGRGFLWCYTGLEENNWEPCFLSDHPIFKGTENVTKWTELLPGRLLHSSFYRCNNTEWISLLSYCDGVIDCLDASDETDCVRDDGTCLIDEFTCDDGGCIQLSKVCDHVQNCNDGSDEYCDLRPCGQDEFTCDNGQCIAIGMRCNAFTECIDKSDEHNCDIDSCTASGAFHCDFAKCIPNRLVCDTFPDCEDGSDERSCYNEPVKLCDDLWRTGHHSFGNNINCDFSTVLSDGIITFTLNHLDIDLTESGNIWVYTLSTDLLKDMTFINEIDHYYAFNDCSQTVRLTCPFVERIASVYDDPTHMSVYPYCGCTLYSLHNPKRSCNGTKGLSEPENLDFKFNGFSSSSEISIGDLDMLHAVIQEDRPLEFSFSPIRCTQEIHPTLDVIACRGDIKVIPLSERCVYDIDGSGFRTGCRSGSNIEYCEDFVCPNGTVKCPGSYCIPTRFVCDGSVQCPGSEDEKNCYCTNTQREIIILNEDSTNDNKLETVVENLARQFYTPGSIVRILHYSIFTPLEAYFIEHRGLNIREERIHPYEVIKRTESCRYNVFANNLLKHIEFQTQSLKGVIVIEDSDQSSIVTRLMLANVTKRPDINIYRVLQDSSADRQYKPDLYELVTDIRVRRWDALSSFGHRYFPDICEADSSVPCKGGYRCSASKQCLSLNQICDGVSHCLNGDDERLCDFACPQQCYCSGFSLRCSAQNMTQSDLQYISSNTRSADLSQNTALYSVLSYNVLGLSKLFRLNLSLNEIETITPNAFIEIRNLLMLDLSSNRIKVLPENVFIHLKYLKHLNLDGNDQLESIAATAFHGLVSLRHIRITGTKLRIVLSYSFVGLDLHSIDISNNQIEEIQDLAFSDASVENINIDGNAISSFNKDVFTGLTSLRNLKTPEFKFCCVRPTYVDENNCLPEKNEFSSCEDLMRLPVLQTILWLVGLSSLIGNIGSVLYRLVYDKERLKIGFGIFVTNLAVADFLMGIYLIIIAVADSIYRKRYIFEDEYWRNSNWCTFAGILSSISSEASVLFVCLITIDRLLVIKYPFGQFRITTKIAVRLSVIAWILAITLAVIPVIDTSYFKNKFYSRSGVCAALPLTRDQPPGWEYSVSIFVGLNFITFSLVALGQLLILLEIRKPTVIKSKSEAARRRDIQVTRNLILIATTDFLCWFPIGVMGSMALLSYPIPGEVYAWTVVFILPFNSALNPVLYTLTAIFGKKKFTPRAAEQTGNTDIEKENGNSILQFMSVNRLVRLSKGKFLKDSSNIQDLIEGEGMNMLTVTRTAWMLSKYLSVLHEKMLVVDDLNMKSVYLTMEKNKVRFVRLDSQLSLEEDTIKFQHNVFQLGLLLKGLIAKSK